MQLVQHGETHARRTADYSLSGRVVVASKCARLLNIVELVNNINIFV